MVTLWCRSSILSGVGSLRLLHTSSLSNNRLEFVFPPLSRKIRQLRATNFPEISLISEQSIH